MKADKASSTSEHFGTEHFGTDPNTFRGVIWISLHVTAELLRFGLVDNTYNQCVARRDR
jgi:hypothetical protein